jgi:uncharacterized protein YbaR (Trm112 family)
MTPDPGEHPLSSELLEIIRCPACLGDFLPPEPAALVCSACGRRYPVRNGVPVLLVDEAEQPGAAAGTD